METTSQAETATAAMPPASMLKRKRSAEPDAVPQLPPTAAAHHSQPHHQPQLQQQQQQQHHQLPQHHAAVPPPTKAPKTHNHLQINYLARQNDSDLPLVSTKDSMPEVVDLLNQYQSVLERHESLACNLGARPLGPILIKRFERLFEGPPRVLKSHGKEGANITWLDVVEFARNKPEQFTLAQMSEGRKVCQFYTKQCRVQISEEDYVLISSGIPQKMIPPQPIVEDEEKELGSLEILEERLDKICKLADQVAARARQLNHRIKGRKTAILDRRATEPSFRALSPSNAALANGATQSPTPGFVAVNSRPPEANGAIEYSKSGASAATRKELLGRFTSLDDRRTSIVPPDTVRAQGSASTPLTAAAMGGSHQAPEQELAALLMPPNNVPAHHRPEYGGRASISGPATPGAQGHSASYIQHHNTGSPGHQPATFESNAVPPHMQANAASRPAPPPHAHDIELQHQLGMEKDKPDDGPFKSEMVARMESLGKGERVIPPCDRCRRLHMDCLKNLTACVGCTKKHAKCSWREVREDEVLRFASVMRPQHASSDSYHSVPLDPAMHSPLFESTYQPQVTTNAQTPGYASHGYEQAASPGTRDDSGSERVDKPPRVANTGAETEAVFSAAQDAKSSSSAHVLPSKPAQESHPTESEPAVRAAYLESLTKYTPAYVRPNHESHEPTPHAGGHETPETKHEGATRPGPETASTPNKLPVDAHVTGMDNNQVEMIRQRLLRAQQDSPDHTAQKHEDRRPTPEQQQQQQQHQRVTDHNAQHNRIWADDRPGSDSGTAAATTYPGPHNTLGTNSNTNASNNSTIHATSQSHRDPPDGIQPAQPEPSPAPRLSESAAREHVDDR